VFFSCAFACAGALVPRVEELQGTTTPITLVIVIALLLSFAVNSSPGGALAHVLAFVPVTAPITMPGRIVQGAAPAWDVAAAVLVTLAAAAALVPLAARIYRGPVLQTGSAVKLRQAWRSARG
jgi:ABC-2 type transport system permease protein